MANQKRPTPLLWQRLYTQDCVEVTTQRVLLNGDFQLHSHDFIELVLIVSGRGHHLSLNGERALRPGEVIALRPGTWHAYLQCRQLEVYNCCFSGNLLQHELTWLKADPLLQSLFGTGPLLAGRHGLSFLELDPTAFPLCLHHLEAIDTLKQKNSIQQKPAIVGHLLLFLSHLATCLERLEAQSLHTHSIPAHVLQGMNLLEDQLAFPWDLAQLAAQLGLDRSYLVRLFTRHVGLSPIAYLTRLRMERALDLLIHTDLSISQIGQEIGWPDPRHFSRSFKAQMSLSASAYRAKFFAQAHQPDQTHQILS